MSPFSIVSAICSHLPRTVLDVGSGSGWIAKEFADAGSVVTMIDPAPRQDNLRSGQVVKATLEGYVAPAPFELVIANNVSHVVSYDTLGLLLRLKELVSTEGHIYVTLFGEEDDWAHLPHAKAVDLEQALRLIGECGLRPVYRSVAWFDAATQKGIQKRWHVLTFLLARLNQ